MNHRALAICLLLLAGSALSIYRLQEGALAQHQEALAHLQLGATSSAPDASDIAFDVRSHPSAPSAEVLRLRGQVGVLRQALAATDAREQARRNFSNDWQTIYSGPRPSERPGFVYFTNLVEAGFSTPESALQSFHYVMGRQQIEPLTDTSMKQIWDVPDDYDQPPGYNIDLGEGFYGGIGYRIVHSDLLSSNTARLTIDYEKEDGSSYRRDKILVATSGQWRMRPVSVTRAHAGN